MELFKWTNDYSVKYKVLDNEHKQLFKLINDLYSAFMDKEANEKLSVILDELHEYTVYHFAHEEEILKEKKQELSPEHLQAHKDFIDKIATLKEKHEKGMSVVKYEMMNFLRKWLTDHIKDTDKKYSAAFD